tara:strand:+ start:359 stop:1018 length:660 start_codon:yes stop_codon:yes gene_type:complete
MRDKYLYFGIAAPATMAFDNHTAQTLQLTTGGFINPLPTGKDFIANGGLKVTVAYNANITFGTGYTNLVGEIEVNPAALTYNGVDTITIATAGDDPVWGITKSGTGNHNDWDVTQLKPYDDGDALVYNSRHLKGIAVSGAATTALTFVPKTGDTAAFQVDVVTVTHGSGKFKEFAQGLTDIIADDNKVSGMVVIADDMRSLTMPEDASSIASVAAVLDT